jgi:hypothetical protein
MYLRPSFRRPSALILAGLIGSSYVSPVLAARTVRVAEVTTVATESTAAFDEAMRTALVRITGRRDADQDPAFATLLSDPRRYVQIYRPVGNPPGILVTLDGAAIERAVVAAGKSVWPHDRPVVLVVLGALPAGVDAEEARQSLQQTAAFRGLPVIISDAVVGGVTGSEQGSEAALAAARGQGADAALLAHAQADGTWRWSLYTAAASEAFDGSLASGIHGAADALASSTQTVLSQPESEALLRVEGIASLRDYATVSRLLSALSGVRNATVIGVGASNASFRLMLRGGADGLVTLLAGASHLRAISADGGTLVYQFQP